MEQRRQERSLAGRMKEGEEERKGEESQLELSLFPGLVSNGEKRNEKKKSAHLFRMGE